MLDQNDVDVWSEPVGPQPMDMIRTYESSVRRSPSSSTAARARSGPRPVVCAKYGRPDKRPRASGPCCTRQLTLRFEPGTHGRPNRLIRRSKQRDVLVTARVEKNRTHSVLLHEGRAAARVSRGEPRRTSGHRAAPDPERKRLFRRPPQVVLGSCVEERNPTGPSGLHRDSTGAFRRARRSTWRILDRSGLWSARTAPGTLRGSATDPRAVRDFASACSAGGKRATSCWSRGRRIETRARDCAPLLRASPSAKNLAWLQLRLCGQGRSRSAECIAFSPTRRIEAARKA